MTRHHAITLDQIAARGGVSRATVSKILHPGGRRYPVSPVTAARIRELARRMGYTVGSYRKVPNEPERSLIGLVTAECLPLSTSCYGDVPNALGIALAEHGMDLTLVINHDGWRQWSAERRDQQLRAAILLEYVSSEIDLLIQRSTIPLFLFNFPFVLPVDQAMIDHGPGVANAAAHLLQLGHRHLIYVAPKQSRHPASLVGREQGLTRAVHQAGGTVHRAQGPDEALPLIERWPETTALVTYSEQEVPSLVAALYRQGLSVPGRFSLLSLDGPPCLDWVHPAITCLRIPWERMAREAVAFLKQRLDGLASPPQCLSYTETLFVRESTAAPAHRS